MFKGSYFETQSLLLQQALKETPFIDLSIDVIIEYDGKTKDKNLKLAKNYILWSKKNWIKLDNLFMDHVVKKDSDKSGISLTRGKQKLYIYGEIEVLEHYLLKYVIQNGFQKKYRVIKKLAAGTSSQVFQVRHRSYGESYAAKVMSKLNNKKEWILKELEILRILDHPNIIKFIEAHETEDKVILIFEFLLGGSLDEHISKVVNVNEDQAKLVIKQLLSAVSYLHNMGIFHRDIKPQNILIRNTNSLDQIVLSDFGLSDYYNERGTYIFQKCGTPGFAAPEVISTGIYDLKIDVFSIGLVMHLLITGIMAFQSSEYDDLVLQNSQGNINFSYLKISEQGLNFMRQLLEKNPNFRIHSYDALNHNYIEQRSQIRKSALQIRYKMPTLHTKRPSLEQLQSQTSVLSTSLGSPSTPQSAEREASKIVKGFVIKKSKFIKL